MIGQILDGRYRLTVRLGEGGMGEVYAAEHVHIEKRVAIKLLRSEILTNQEAVTRFRQEARSASSIGHRNIIAIEDFGQLPDGRIYLAMELLHGAPLSELLKTSQLPERLLDILIQTGHGLSAAHRKGIVHRDMKPENVFVTTTPEGEDVPKLLDFGIAKVSGADGNNHLTRTGTIFGTPFYMAPEQALGQNVDHRADIYAMGVIMYEVFGGAVPFQGESFMGILTQHITAEPKPPAQMAAEHGRVLPSGVAEIVLRAMRKDPDHRYQSMDELVADLVAVHRRLAGAGMSSTMQAYPPARMRAPAPLPRYARPGSHAGPAHTPMPHGNAPGAPGPLPYSVPLPDAQYSGSGLPPAPDSGILPRKKSRFPLIALLLALMAAAGGAVAVLVLSQNKDDTRAAAKKRSGQSGADRGLGANGSGREGAVPTEHRPAQSGQGSQKEHRSAGAEGPAGSTGAESGARPGGSGMDGTDGSGSAAAAAGSASTSSAGDGQDTGVDTNPGGDVSSGRSGGDKAVVLVNSRPEGAEIIGPHGESLGQTPTNVWVESGQPLQVTLRLKGRKDLSASIDDRKKKVTLKLERLSRRDAGGTGSDGRGERATRGGETARPSGPCAEDPTSVECRCQKDPNLPECGLE